MLYYLYHGFLGVWDFVVVPFKHPYTMVQVCMWNLHAGKWGGGGGEDERKVTLRFLSHESALVAWPSISSLRKLSILCTRVLQ